MPWFTKVLGDPNEKVLKRIQPIVDEVNELEPDFKALSDAQLAEKTAEFRRRLEEGEELEDLLPEAFASVREAALRALGQRHFDVQLIGGVVLHEGKIAEMKTGEGKTLVATLPAYLNALTGEGVHLVTVNDYLARRDAGWNGRIFHLLGMTTGCIISSGGSGDSSFIFDPDFTNEHSVDERLRHLRPITRAEAYRTDITYGTNNEYGFDYLRDNLAQSREQCVQRPLAYAIVDEVDNILIDEARTPLIISGQAEESAETYYQFARLVPKLRETSDYEVDYKQRAVTLNDDGIAHMEKLLGVENIYDERNYELAHYLEQALKAHALFKRDVDYLVRDSKVIIVDPFTGRALEGRRYSEGLHQALEAKEGVRIERENITQATITFQNYFRLYKKLAGMTGTAYTEREEFFKIYHLDVVVIPTHQPMVRKDQNDVVYKTEKAKFDAVVQAIKERHEAGQPVLVGTVSIEKSEVLSSMLLRAGVPHNVLNAKQHEREALIVEGAGQKGAVTLATNMAGRGTDIKLGDGVVEVGGLHIVGTERHESRRIDNQLRGRSGRQGDPGSSRFYVSLEDDLMRRVGSDRVKGILDRLGLPDDEPIENSMVSKSIESAQTKVEGWNFDARKYLVQYDDVIAGQRAVIYADRQRILAGEDVNDIIAQMVHEEITKVVTGQYLADDYADNWDVVGLFKALKTMFPLPTELNEQYVRAQKKADILQEILDEADLAYERREEDIGAEFMRQIERFLLLSIMDRRWIQHIDALDELREGVQLQVAGQRDPLVSFRTTASVMFNELQETIRHEVSHAVYQFEVQRQPPPPPPPPSFSVNPVPTGAATATSSHASSATAVAQRPAPSTGAPGFPTTRTMMGPPRPQSGATKLGRNDPCWCGSGRKFKQCHGRG